MKKSSSRMMLIATAFVVVTVSGCSIASTPPDMVALHYKGGPLESRSFEDCIPVSTRDINGFGDKHYMYPTSLRTYTAANTDAAERGPVTVVSKDNVEMDVPVTVTLTLNTDCETLRTFHESIGNRNLAFWGGTEFEDDSDIDQDGTPDGWLKMLDIYVGESMTAELDRASQGYNWRPLWNDPVAKNSLEDTLDETLEDTVNERMGGDFIRIQSILVQKPTPVNQELVNEVNGEQQAVARATAAQREAEATEISAVAEAKAAQARAEAEVAVEAAEAAKIAELIEVMGEEAWLRKYAIDQGITPWPNPVVPGANTSGQ